MSLLLGFRSHFAPCGDLNHHTWLGSSSWILKQRKNCSETGQTVDSHGTPNIYWNVEQTGRNVERIYRNVERGASISSMVSFNILIVIEFARHLGLINVINKIQYRPRSWSYWMIFPACSNMFQHVRANFPNIFGQNASIFEQTWS